MRKLRLPLLLLGLILSFSTVPTRTASAGPGCLIDCWELDGGPMGSQICWQDESCNVHCCNEVNGWCPNPCWN
jgi:hypothetical protein